MKKQNQGGIGAQGLPSQSVQGAGAQAASSVAASYEQIQQSMTRNRPSMYFGSNSNTKKAHSSYADRRKRAEELMSRIQ